MKCIRNSINLYFFLSLCVLQPVFTQGLSSVSVTPIDQEAGVTTVYTISFTTAQDIPVDGKIELVFPADFSVSQAALASATIMDGSLVVTKAGQTVTITRSGGTVFAGGLSDTLQLYNITNSDTAGSSYTVDITTRQSDDTAIDAGSAIVSILPGSLDQFSISGIGASHIAGSNISVTFTARDSYGNTVTSFIGSATLNDETGSVSPQQTTNFTSGTWTGNIDISNTYTDNVVYVQASGKAGQTLPFTVTPAALNQFDFDLINSPQTAGSDFTVTITAKDIFNNIKTDFLSTVALTEKNNSLTVFSTGTNTTPAFSSGICSCYVNITKADQDIQIQATGSGKTGTSGFFNVNPAGVDHFGIQSVSTQEAGKSFQVNIKARDAYSNVASGFNSSVSISHSGTGSITPSASGSFFQGVKTVNVTVNQAQNGDKINVDDGSGHTGSSNVFNIVSSSVDHFTFISAIGGTQTAGAPFSLTMIAEDINNNQVNSFNGNVLLEDETKTFSQQVTFSGGTWTGNVTITESNTSDFLTATGVGKSSQSGTFDIIADSVSSFEIDPITSPQTAGNAFSIRIVARDTWGNQAAGFNNSTVQISDGAVSVLPTTSSTFSSGLLNSQSITITQAASDIQIIVEDGAGHAGTSTYFNVNHNSLDHFDISPFPLADQATGELFAITVIAKDAHGNSVLTFDGSGNTVNITHIGSASVLDPDISDPFIDGVWTGNLEITQTITNDQITVTRTGGSESGKSSSFNVSPSDVDHFRIATIPVSQTAGQDFTVQIWAEDEDNNTVTSFGGIANLDDATGTITPKEATFTSGFWSGPAQITKSGTDNAVVVTGVGKNSLSNRFTVIPASVDTLIIGPVGSPQTAGHDFAITITAQDAFGNTATSFNDDVNLHNTTGTISPGISNNFNSGILNTQLIRIDEAHKDEVLMVIAETGETGVSNPFNVVAGNIDHFSIDPVGDKVNGDPFTINIQARDANDNVITNYTGTVDIDDLTGTIQPNISGQFINGIWSGGVSVYHEYQNDTITVQQTGGGLFAPLGASNAFDVVTAPGARISSFVPLLNDTLTQLNSITTGQTRNWFFRMSVQNFGGADLVLDSLEVQCMVNGAVQTDYDIVYPAVFPSSGTDTLFGGQTDTLLIRVDEAGSQAGSGVFKGKLSFTNVETGGIINADTLAYIAVQTPAELSISTLSSPTEEVTSGQSLIWTLYAVVRNKGTSDILIDPGQDVTKIIPSKGSDWDIEPPPSLQDGDWILEGGDIDSLEFVIKQTGSGAYGTCIIDFFIKGTEINTGRSINSHTQTQNSAEVTIEAQAALQIVSVTNLAVNEPNVNTNQSFSIEVKVKNSGGDLLKNVDVRLTGPGGIVLNSSQKINQLAGDDTEALIYDIRTGGSSRPSETITASASGTAENTDIFVNYEVANVDDNITTLVIQRPADLKIVKVIPSETEVKGGQTDEWYVKVAVKNSGEAPIYLDKPSSDDLSFKVEDIPSEGYSIEAPSELKLSKGLYLYSNAMAVDTLIYKITSTGRLGGPAQVSARITGIDKNDTTKCEAYGSASIFVEDVDEFFIYSTQIIGVPNTTDAGNGYLDYGQSFEVLVIVNNGLGSSLENIQVRMQHDKSSILTGDSIQTMRTLEKSSRDSVRFFYQADSSSASPETFTAAITEAFYNDGVTPVPVGTADDSAAYAYIQEPARVRLRGSIQPADGILPRNQSFTVKAELFNMGGSSLGDTGSVRIKIPDGYTLSKATRDSQKIPLNVPVQWNITSPIISKNLDRIRITLEDVPINKNTGEPCGIDSQKVYLDVITISSDLKASLSISSPAGAMDSVISTEQAFVVSNHVTWSNASNIRSTIDLPDIYRTNENLEKSIPGSGGSGDITWTVYGPIEASLNDTIWVSTSAIDSLGPQNPVGAPNTYLIVSAVKKAELSLHLEIVSPPEAAQYGTVSPEQNFTIKASMQNEGEADISGTTKVRLKPLTNGYTTKDPLTKDLQNGGSHWTIKSPKELSSGATTISVLWAQKPLDVNTNSEAEVKLSITQSVSVTLISSWMSVSISPLSNFQPASIVPGQENVPLMSLEFGNKGLEGDHRISIEQIQLYVEDLNGQEISPSEVLSSLRVVDGDDSTKSVGSVFSLGDQNPVQIPLNDVIVATQSNISLMVQGSLVSETDIPYFRLAVRNQGDIQAKATDTGYSIQIFTPTGDSLTVLSSEFKKIYNPEFEEPVWNCPNPFGGINEEATTITYHLTEEEDVNLFVFTLIGELVWSRSFVGGEHYAIAGTNEIVWDGTNDQGQEVINGVYLFVLQTESGVVYHTKLAVFR